MRTRRLCFALDLKDDPALIARYRKWHQPGGPPRAVKQSLLAAGIRKAQIYLCGNRLFMILQVAPEFSLEEKARLDAGNPDVQAWEQQMWSYQQPLPWARPGEKWVLAEKIYELADQP